MMPVNTHEQPQGGRPPGSDDDIDQEMATRAAQGRADSFRRLPEMERDHERQCRTAT